MEEEGDVGGLHDGLRLRPSRGWMFTARGAGQAPRSGLATGFSPGPGGGGEDGTGPGLAANVFAKRVRQQPEEDLQSSDVAPGS